MNHLKDIATILQIGFSGFAFLMAGLSYKLLRSESSRDGRPRSSILQSIKRYTTYTLIMAVLVIASKFCEQGLDYYFKYKMTIAKEQLISTSIEARNCHDALLRLMYAETKITNDYSSILKAVQDGMASCEGTLERLENEKNK